MTKKPQGTKVIDDGHVDHFYMTPNMIDDIPMDVYAFRLYAHLKRVAGESGKCWQATDTLAEHCGMSPHTVLKAKKKLVELRFIDIHKVKTSRGGQYSDVITITNIWQRNTDTYAIKPKPKSYVPMYDANGFSIVASEDTSGYDEIPCYIKVPEGDAWILKEILAKKKLGEDGEEHYFDVATGKEVDIC